MTPAVMVGWLELLHFYAAGTEGVGADLMQEATVGLIQDALERGINIKEVSKCFPSNAHRLVPPPPVRSDRDRTVDMSHV
jgi:hypothetical protein